MTRRNRLKQLEQENTRHEGNEVAGEEARELREKLERMKEAG